MDLNNLTSYSGTTLPKGSNSSPFRHPLTPTLTPQPWRVPGSEGSPGARSRHYWAGLRRKRLRFLTGQTLRSLERREPHRPPKKVAPAARGARRLGVIAVTWCGMRPGAVGGCRRRGLAARWAASARARPTRERRAPWADGRARSKCSELRGAAAHGPGVSVPVRQAEALREPRGAAPRDEAASLWSAGEPLSAAPRLPTERGGEPRSPAAAHSWEP